MNTTDYSVVKPLRERGKPDGGRPVVFVLKLKGKESSMDGLIITATTEGHTRNHLAFDSIMFIYYKMILLW